MGATRSMGTAQSMGANRRPIGRIYFPVLSDAAFGSLCPEAVERRTACFPIDGNIIHRGELLARSLELAPPFLQRLLLIGRLLTGAAGPFERPEHQQPALRKHVFPAAAHRVICTHPGFDRLAELVVMRHGSDQRVALCCRRGFIEEYVDRVLHRCAKSRTIAEGTLII